MSSPYKKSMIYSFLMCMLVIASDSQKSDVMHPCTRQCKDQEAPMTCNYTFKIEWYLTTSKACYDCPNNITHCDLPHCVAADGNERPILVANRQFPGPSIQVCENDVVVVNVENDLHSETTSIHWHGLYHAGGTATMDGVPMITQCPILPKTSFQYKYVADHPGTHFWHSHSGVERVDGLFGNLIVRQSPSKEKHYKLYDYDLPEHVMIFHDWVHDETALSKYTKSHHKNGNVNPKAVLINGKGVYKDARYPHATFNVKKGSRYRFRLINSGSFMCPFQVFIQNHKLEVIASDGGSFEPYVVDSLVIYAGERYDFIITANATVDNYWIHAKGLKDCIPNSAKQSAILRYAGAANGLPAGGILTYQQMENYKLKKTLNPLNIPASEDMVYIAEMDSTRSGNEVSEKDPLLKDDVDVKFYLGFDFKYIDNDRYNDPIHYPISKVPEKLYTPQINDISMMMPPSPPLSQYDDLPKEKLCNSKTVTNCGKRYCECIHMLEVELGQTVEIIMVDEGTLFNASHPIHLHGYKFKVVAMKKLGGSTTVDFVKQLDSDGKIPRKLSRAIYKDTVIVPDGGYTVIRFHADNPGMWLMHCHIEFHLEIGMGLMIKVGNPSQFPAIPKKFPRCGPFSSGFSSQGNSYMFLIILIVMLLL